MVVEELLILVAHRAAVETVEARMGGRVVPKVRLLLELLIPEAEAEAVVAYRELELGTEELAVLG